MTGRSGVKQLTGRLFLQLFHELRRKAASLRRQLNDLPVVERKLQRFGEKPADIAAAAAVLAADGKNAVSFQDNPPKPKIEISTSLYTMGEKKLQSKTRKAGRRERMHKEAQTGKTCLRPRKKVSSWKERKDSEANRLRPHPRLRCTPRSSSLQTGGTAFPCSSGRRFRRCLRLRSRGL